MLKLGEWRVRSLKYWFQSDISNNDSNLMRLAKLAGEREDGLCPLPSQAISASPTAALRCQRLGHVTSVCREALLQVWGEP
uniref:Uncharacterized protein n=1 Tax=Anguilla anguilla TaxID=7936 RepID=A0A0E9SK66_ANGAN